MTGLTPDALAKTASSAYDAILEVIGSVERRIADAIRPELADQRASLKLIASENYASPAVLLAMGNWFSDKYAEGTIGHRFYAGCQNVDTVEALAAEQARELFGAPYAYVQPHSGIDANLVAFWSILAHRVEKPALAKLGARNVNDLSDADWEELRGELGNQRMLGMSLDAGGHLTHGFRPNISGKLFDQRPTAPTPRPACSTTTRCAPGAGVPAADHRGRLLGLPAPGQLRPDARDRRRGRRHADGRHGPLRRPGRRQGVHRRRGPGPPRPHHHHHDPQVAARAARRHGAGQAEYSPSSTGAARWCWAARSARDGGQGRRAGRGAPAGVPDYAQQIVDNAQSLAEGFLNAGRASSSRAAPTTTSCCSTCAVRPHRAPGRVGPARRRRRHQPQLGPAGPQRRLVHVRRPPRHPGADHPRLRSRRVRRGGRADRRRALQHPARHQTKAGAPSKATYDLPTASPTASRPPPRRCSTSTRCTRASS